MSFSISLVGTKKGLIRELDKIRSSENTQLEHVKELCAKEVEAFPDTVKSIQIETSGHYDTTTRYFRIEVKPIYAGYAFDEEEVDK